MKIGLISINMFSKGLNFACPLHTYAFQQFLLKNGIESTVITYKPIYYNNFDLKHPYDYYVRICNDYINSGSDKENPEEWERRSSLRDAYKEIYEERERRYDKFQNFIDSNYIKTEECYNSDLLEVKDPGFDCYICCTDVIWKNNPNIGFDRGFFLASKAMENKWKIAYAASRGPFYGLTEEEEKTFLYYVQDFDAISVREESLKDYLNEKIPNKVTPVLDPVLLHEKELYDKLLVKPKEEKYLFLYYVMEKAEDTITYAVKYAKEHNLKIVEVTDRPLKNGRLTEYTDVEVLYKYDIGVEEWLGYIKNADCVFTNSFHCSCFSILFEKQFFVGARNGDKVTHVLDMFGLSERRIDKENDFSRSSQPDIDYETVKPIMDEKRRESAEFILSAIRFAETNNKPLKDYSFWKRAIKYRIFSNSGKYQDVEKGSYDPEKGEIRSFPSGSWEFRKDQPVTNDGTSRFEKNLFIREGYTPDGWKLRFKIDNEWFWYLEDGTLAPRSEYNSKNYPPIRKFKDDDCIPFIPVTKISIAVAEALWKKDTVLVYNGGLKLDTLTCNYDEQNGEIKRLDTGSLEYRLNEKLINNGQAKLVKNTFECPEYDFLGWRMRIKVGGTWYWYLADGTLAPTSQYNAKNDGERCLLKDGANIPYIPADYIETVVFEGVWKKQIVLIYNSGLKSKDLTCSYDEEKGEIKRLGSGSLEYTLNETINRQEKLIENKFKCPGYAFLGWKMRVKNNNKWYWYLADGSLKLKSKYNAENDGEKYLLADGSNIPYIPFASADKIVLDGVWRAKFKTRLGRWIHKIIDK